MTGCFGIFRYVLVSCFAFVVLEFFLHLAVLEVLLNTCLMLAQLELDGRAAAASLGLESVDFSQELQVMQVSLGHWNPLDHEP